MPEGFIKIFGEDRWRSAQIRAFRHPGYSGLKPSQKNRSRDVSRGFT